jgi:hypothetical protein
MTVAGVPGHPGDTGDGGPATSAELRDPASVTSLSGGGFLIADTNNNVVREVSPSGTIETIAGDGFDGFSGDGGDATAASLSGPDSAAPSADGGILIGDGNNGAVREITTAPVSTITLQPAAPNGSDGWYSSVKALVTSPVEGLSSSITTVAGPGLSCELDPTEPPPAFAAIVPGCPFEFPAAVSGNGTHTLYAASENTFGDQENPVSVTFKIDSSPPTLTCGRAPLFARGTKNARVLATLTDRVSGPSSERVSARVSTSRLGKRTVVLRAANNAGIRGSKRCRYNVVARKRRRPR